MSKVAGLIKQLNMQPHPEGGYYARQHTGAIWSSSYYLLPGGECSRWHEVGAEELLLFHAGDPLQIHMISESGELSVKLLGASGCFQLLVPMSSVLAMRCAQNQTGYSLISCVVSPAFDFNRFRLYTAAELARRFPQVEPNLLRQFSLKESRN